MKAPIGLKPLASKSTSMFRQNMCHDVLSKLTVAPLRESVRDIGVIPELGQTPAIQHSSENQHNTIKLPSQIGGSKASQSYLSNNLSNILEQTDPLSKDDQTSSRLRVFTLPIQISNFNEAEEKSKSVVCEALIDNQLYNKLINEEHE